MLISIIVPIYNIESYLRECVESVLKQTYRNWELILVDDGSSDGSPMICDEYAKQDSRINVIHKANGGLVSARKTGLLSANGDYVMPLDGDDFLDVQCLNTIVKSLENSSPDVLCFGYFIYFEGQVQSNPIKAERYGLYEQGDIEKDIFPAFIHGSDTSHFPHNLWAKVYKMGEDGACTYPLIFNAQTLVLLPECLYYYRQVRTSMTKVKKPLSWDNYDLVFQLYRDEIDLTKFDMLQQYYRARTHNLFNIVLSQFYQKKKLADIVNEINSRFIEHPDYSEAVNNSSFSTLTMKLSRLILKKKMYFVFFLISKNKPFVKSLFSTKKLG